MPYSLTRTVILSSLKKIIKDFLFCKFHDILNLSIHKINRRKKMTVTLTLIIATVVIAFFGISIYNGLVTKRLRTKEAWSTVETQLKRRYELIPNLVETVKGYAKHESKTLENVTNARNMAMSIKDTSVQKEQYENMLTSSLKSLFAVSESYPDLKANQNFLELQQELEDTENKIQAARQFYNTTVLSYNAAIAVFPNNLIAGAFHFTQERFFELEEEEKKVVRQAVKVQF